jgi:hypothetical protein
MMPVCRIVAMSVVLATGVAAYQVTAAANATGAAVDPIDELVQKLSADPLWLNGRYPDLDLAADAPTDQLIARVLERTGFEDGYVKTHRILETRVVRIKGEIADSYLAALVDTDLGRKIVLLKYERTGWWSRVYAVRSSA